MPPRSCRGSSRTENRTFLRGPSPKKIVTLIRFCVAPTAVTPKIAVVLRAVPPPKSVVSPRAVALPNSAVVMTFVVAPPKSAVPVHAAKQLKFVTRQTDSACARRRVFRVAVNVATLSSKSAARMGSATTRFARAVWQRAIVSAARS
jgi:hypothetical protein